jgi:hypothetical protein
MSKPKQQDPAVRAKKAERRRRRQEAVAAGAQMLPRRPRPTAQMDHASNPKGVKHSREGQRAMDRERGRNPMNPIVPTLAEVRERRLPLDGQALARTDFESTAYDGNDHEGVTDVERANLITSIVDTGGLSHLGGTFATHKVVIDVDLPVSLIASSTPGHFHLFIDKAMDWPTYLALLEALTAAGIVEPGYLAAAERRGHTAVRLPWVRKPGSGVAPEPECTHGGDCQIHPSVNALHNFDPPAARCRSDWYADTGNVQNNAHHDRSVHCGLSRGHDGDHDELLDGEPAGVVTWPQKAAQSLPVP